MASFKLGFLLVLFSLNTALGRVLNAERDESPWGNSKMMVTGDMCQDCTQIVELLVDLISNADTLDLIKNTLDGMCKRLPGPQTREICQKQVDQVLPVIISFLSSAIKPGQICVVLGLCSSQSDDSIRELLTNDIHTFFKSTMAIPGGGYGELAGPKCKLCIYLLKTLERLMPKQAEAAVVKLLGRVCGLLPSSLKGQCESLIERFGKTLLEFLMRFLSPQSICSLLQLCAGRQASAPVSTPLSDCDSCLTLAVLGRLHLGSNATDLQTSSFLASVCLLHSGALHECEDFAQRHGDQLMQVLGKPEASLDLCGRVDLCGGGIEVSDLGRDPCTLDNSYRCRDLKTALECGTIQFCQKFMWK